MKTIVFLLLCFSAFGQSFPPSSGSGGTATGVEPYSATFAGTEPGGSRTITAATHGQGTKPAVLYCERTSDGVRTYGWADTNSAGDITIVPAAGAAYTGYCQIAAGNGIQGPAGAAGADGATGPAGAGGVSYSGTLASWGTIGAGACVEKALTATGAVAGDVPALGPPTLPTGIVAMATAASNLITVRLCNITGSGIAVSDGSYSASVIRIP